MFCNIDRILLRLLFFVGIWCIEFDDDEEIGLWIF